MKNDRNKTRIVSNVQKNRSQTFYTMFLNSSLKNYGFRKLIFYGQTVLPDNILKNSYFGRQNSNATIFHFDTQ